MLIAGTLLALSLSRLRRTSDQESLNAAAIDRSVCVCVLMVAVNEVGGFTATRLAFCMDQRAPVLFSDFACESRVWRISLAVCPCMRSDSDRLVGRMRMEVR